MIAFKNVNKNFAGGVQALKDVNLTIETGDIFGVIGFSGAGKSTLLRMVNALEKPTSGHVEIDGQVIDTLGYSDLRHIRQNIGMVFQQFNLLENKTVFANVAIPLILQKQSSAQITARVNELLDFVELTDKADAYPRELSGGQKQRVGIARALATSPSILLCDEATSALDPETTDSILDLLARINSSLGLTILFVTHQIQVIQRLCKHVAVMEGGRVIEKGTVLEVFSAPEQAMTKRFVQTVIPDKLPNSLCSVLKKDRRSFRLLRLRFLGENTQENLLFKLNTALQVETSVLFASVTELQGEILGIFIVQLIASPEKLTEATEYIASRGIKWQEVSL
ncbi:MAG: ATP-binding cassette domain-containing protein [Selenomonadaceae bacterium]|nr:ATP-binding cassette domain-containing protein [Selenomonadaceae bacterium]